MQRLIASPEQAVQTLIAKSSGGARDGYAGGYSGAPAPSTWAFLRRELLALEFRLTQYRRFFCDAGCDVTVDKSSYDETLGSAGGETLAAVHPASQVKLVDMYHGVDTRS